MSMDKPVLLICACRKYKYSLLEAIKRFESPIYKIIGVMGDLNSPTHFNGRILTLQVEDTYEYLPKKLRMAFSWIVTNFPDSPGIFKTDDDITIDDKNLFLNSITQNINTPWWGILYRNDEASDPTENCINNYTDKSLIKLQPAGVYLQGAGYWIKRELIDEIINFENFWEVGSEDRIFGTILSNKGYNPKIIEHNWSELNREKIGRCKNKECNFKAHRKTEIFEGYCCRSCRSTPNRHGSQCEKRL